MTQAGIELSKAVEQFHQLLISQGGMEPHITVQGYRHRTHPDGLIEVEVLFSDGTKGRMELSPPGTGHKGTA